MSATLGESAARIQATAELLHGAYPDFRPTLPALAVETPFRSYAAA